MTSYKDYLRRVPKGKGNFKSFLFDKVTSLFVKSKFHKIKNPKNFLFIRNDHIGDMVLSLQIFREVKKFFPQSKITVLASPLNKTLIEKDKYVDNIIEIDLFWRRKSIKSFLDYLKVLKKIKNQKFDVGIDLRRSRLNIFFFLFIPKIKSRISFYNVNGGRAFLTHPIFYKKRSHALKENIELLKPLGVKMKNYIPHIMTDAQDKKDVNKFLAKHNLKKYIVICPGATTKSRKWPEKKFKKIIESFHKKYPKYKIIIASGPEDKDLIGRFCINNNCVPLIGFNLRKLVLILKKAKLAIANDGGVRTIASASGTNLIALAGPVNLKVHLPFNRFTVLHHKLSCYP